MFKIKKNSKGEVSRHDAHFVGKGYSQRYVIQNDKVFAPFARFESIRRLMALVAQYRCELHHLDVKSSFMNNEIKREIYVKQPKCSTVKGKEHCVFRLKTALYGLKASAKSMEFQVGRMFILSWLQEE